MPSFKIQTRQINKEGKLAWEYNPLYNLVRSTTNDDGEVLPASLSSFDTEDIKFDINHPVDIECQPSYDGSVNLILNDDKSVPRIVNSGFTLLEDNSYERVSRNQTKPTNVYRNAKLETMLQRCTKEESPAVTVKLDSICKGGELEGGNYVFLFKYMDDDENSTRIVAESGIVSIFKNDGKTNASVLGTLENEKTDLAVKLRLSNIDKSFSKIQVLYRRNYSDLTGALKREYCKITEPFRIPDTSGDMTITITGIEPRINITYDDIIKQFNTYRTVKTQTQVQNMLFFGNVTEYRDEESVLQNLAYQIQVSPILGNSISLDNLETYKSSANIYDNLGYMPGEYYRLGVVFVYNDESLSQAYNLRGCCFDHFGESNIDSSIDANTISYNEIFIGSGPKCYNTRGVFRMPETTSQIASTTTHIHPINLSATIPTEVLQTLKNDLEIRGYFFVRQSRIPLFLGQGLSIGISEGAHCPLLRSVVKNNDNTETIRYGVCTPLDKSEGSNDYFLSEHRIKWFDPNEVETIKSPYAADKDGKWEKEVKRSVKTKGLLCADSYLIPQMQSVLDGSEFVLKPVATYSITGIEAVGTDGYYTTLISPLEGDHRTTNLTRSLIQVPAETPSRIYDNHVFSSKCGSSQDVRSAKTLLVENTESDIPKPFAVMNDDIIRGNFGAYIGVCGDELSPDTIYNIYSTEYPGEILSKIYNYVEKLAYNNSEFYATSDKTYFYTTETPLNTIIAGGDCFYCTVSTKLQYNFLDNNAPLNTSIVSATVTKTFEEGEKYLAGEKFSNISADGWLELNSSDFNAVHFGTIISYQCMSNYNLNIRAIDDQRVDERALYGDSRSFYPRIQANEANSIFKLPESTLLPMGHSSTLRCFPYYVAEQVPFSKKHFDNRIAFSNVQANDSFSNSYRVFTGLSYQDIERTYGSIVKLIPLGSSLFCVFEHGCGIVPINEKALLSTAQGQSIHLYGSQIIQSQVTIVSQDYGTTWEDSIVVTPNGIYGVDTWAKKIWRYTSAGFSLISDQIVQRYLNDNITLSESDLYPIVAVKNVKTHYNNHKGDVMFTFYDDDVCWNLCFNERVDKFVTRYSWTPLLSENIQNSYVSVDRTAVETYAIMAKNMETKQGKFYLNDPKLNYSEYGTHKLTGVTSINSDGSWESKDICDDGFYSQYDLNIDGYADVYNMTTATIKSVTYATWDDKNNKTVITKVENTDDNCFKHAFEELSATIDSAGESNGKKIDLPSKGDMFCLKWGKDLKTEDKFIIPEEGAADLPGHTGQESGKIPEDATDASDELEEDIKIIYDGGQVNDHGFSLITHYNNFKYKARNYVAVEKGKGVRLDVKLNDFVCWLKVELEATPHLENEITVGKYKYSNYTPLHSFKQSIVLIPNYDHLTKTEYQKKSDFNYVGAKEAYDKVNRIGFFVHGRAGIYDEIAYRDSDPDNQIKPTFWYNKQEPFEFEFVVNTGAGMQKIFNNLAIISNNAEPESLEFSIIGDAYDFNKAGIFGKTLVEPIEDEFGIIDSEKTLQAKLAVEYKTAKEIPGIKDVKYSTRIDNGSVSRDTVLQQYYLHVEQPCRNIKEHGKLRGNIEYREDKWLLNIVPIKFQNVKLTHTDGKYDSKKSEIKSAKLRDKWCKVRIKYKGDKLAVISAIQTMFTVSFT